MCFHCLCYHQTLNVSDVVEWLGAPLEDGGIQVYSVLTMPVYNAAKHILGVAQMINKVKQPHNEFITIKRDDEMLVELPMPAVFYPYFEECRLQITRFLCLCLMFLRQTRSTRSGILTHNLLDH